MRARTVLVACVFLFTPLFLTHAAEEAAAEPPKPVHEGENDRCLIEKVSIKEGKVVTEVGKKTAPEYIQCDEANDGNGCTEQLENAGTCSCGKVTYTTPDGKPCTVSKCDSNYKENVKKCVGGSAGLPLPSTDPETGAILEGYIKETGELPEAYSKIFEDAGIDADKILATENREDAARILSRLAFGDEQAKATAAAEAGITPEQLNHLSANAARLVPSTKNAVDTFSGNLSASERTKYAAALDTFSVLGSMGKIQINPNARPPTQAEAALAGQKAYNDVLALGYDPRDLMRQGQSAERMTIAQAVAIEAYRNRLNEMGVLHPELDRALTLSVLRREGGVLGKGIGTQSQTGVLGPMQVTRGNAQTSFGNSPFQIAGNQVLSAADFARSDPIGSYIAGMAGLNRELFKYAPVSNGSYNKQGVVSALQAYNSGTPRSCIGGDCNFGAKAYRDTQVMRQAVASGGSVQTIAQSLGSLYGDRTRSMEERTLWAMALTAKPLDGDYLPPAPYASVPYNPFIARATPPAVGGINSPLNVSPWSARPVGGSASAGSPLGGSRPGAPAAPSTPSKPSTPSSVPGVIPELPQGGGGTSTSPAQELEDALKPVSQTPGTTEPVQAVATIIAQPSGITRGKVIIVSWSSVGTNPAVPCTVMLQSGTTTSVIAQGNEGTRNIETSTTSASGAWDFTLTCTALSDGTKIERTTSVPVQ